MPRTARVVLPHYPHHVVQRGHNKQAVFKEPADFERYLSDLCELKTLLDVKVYAFCLMTNHVHLLLAPGESAASLGQLMKSLAARMTRYRNKLEGRSGTLWESRYKSSVVQTDTYLLACCRYIELNPVRAQRVEHAQDYKWSSLQVRLNATDGAKWLDDYPGFTDLGPTAAIRNDRYIEFMKQPPPPQELELIRSALQRGQLTGNSQFTAEIEVITGLHISNRPRGRPAKCMIET
ncbi:transposase [Pseudomonas baetica]|uniref:transposase n=1 Tax=Pseudomonas baetica TaxID=674054 RepID=UPI00287211FE|nr:transposase [Pseudomonas baetica]MDR9860918.1 transposase [Pseudomonas baetica]